MISSLLLIGLCVYRVGKGACSDGEDGAEGSGETPHRDELRGMSVAGPGTRRGR